MTGEGGPGRVRFLELLSGTGREPGKKAQFQDDCAGALTPPHPEPEEWFDPGRNHCRQRGGGAQLEWV